MKYLLIIILLLIISCEDKPKYKIIEAKSYYTFDGNLLAKGICRFWANNQEFNDSCKFYYVGDTIGVTKRGK